MHTMQGVKTNKLYAINIVGYFIISLLLLFSLSSTLQAATSVKTNQKSVFQSTSLSTDTIMNHLKAFQKIADQNNHNRATGTKGGKASTDYIIKQLKKTPFKVQVLPFKTLKKQKAYNIIVDIKGKNPNPIMLGAHYDSVLMGPGINDNATAVAVLLELVNQLALNKKQPNNSIRVAFWDSEETGIQGSKTYVKSLSAQQIKQIKAYINLDMVGTKHPDTLIYDADKSTVKELEALMIKQKMPKAEYQPLLDELNKVPAHPQDAKLAAILEKFFKQKDIEIKKDLSVFTASDTLPFAGKVPATFIIMFNEKMRGDILDFAPCYHQACDTIDKVSTKSLKLTGEATLNLLQKLDAKW